MKIVTNTNSMEWVGMAHNAAIRHVFGQIELNSRNKPDLATISKLVHNYFKAVGVVTIPKNTLINSKSDVVKAIKSVRKHTETDEGALAISSLFDVFENKPILSQLLARIEEQEHAATSKLKGHDLLFFQGMASTARHSAILWAPIEEGGEDAAHNGTGDIQNTINWDEVAKWDLCGLMAGGPEAGAMASIADIVIQLAE
jgi:hypothetical protein